MFCYKDTNKGISYTLIKLSFDHIFVYYVVMVLLL